MVLLLVMMWTAVDPRMACKHLLTLAQGKKTFEEICSASMEATLRAILYKAHATQYE
jgi:hypothetical protein